MTAEKTPLDRLREPFPAGTVGKLPKPYKSDSPKGNCRECNSYHGLPAMHLDFVGHAAVTDRLLSVDPQWTWRHFNHDEIASLPPAFRDSGLWIQLTVCGVPRPGFGDAGGKTGPNAVKEAIGDALRNAAMRFGVALDLWTKDELEHGHAEHKPDGPAVADPLPPTPPPVAPPSPTKTPEQRARGRMFALLGDVGIGGQSNRDKALAFISQVVGRDVASSSEISDDEVHVVVQVLSDWKSTGTNPMTGETT